MQFIKILKSQLSLRFIFHDYQLLLWLFVLGTCVEKPILAELVRFGVGDGGAMCFKAEKNDRYKIKPIKNSAYN
jgi:hypothetical protein